MHIFRFSNSFQLKNAFQHENFIDQLSLLLQQGGLLLSKMQFFKCVNLYLFNFL